jgi:hypothetical protein
VIAAHVNKFVRNHPEVNLFSKLETIDYRHEKLLSV